MELPGAGAEDLFFHDHADLVRGMAEALDRTGLEEACQAMARHLEQDRDHWLRRLERIEAEPALRAQRAVLIVTTNLPFSEWTTVFPNPRLCKALLDRITDRAHIIETGTESFRFRRTLEKRKGQ